MKNERFRKLSILLKCGTYDVPHGALGCYNTLLPRRYIVPSDTNPRQGDEASEASPIH
ncbi:MAG: hypothetical protein Greene07147_753 [Parcubacteria group bacterium Greene0714_7]|nr:MAG: hypothetical protein Greene07147_753 [Parcubacteria group bacterium Greene0714_7]